MCVLRRSLRAGLGCARGRSVSSELSPSIEDGAQGSGHMAPKPGAGGRPRVSVLLRPRRIRSWRIIVAAGVFRRCGAGFRGPDQVRPIGRTGSPDALGVARSCSATLESAAPIFSLWEAESRGRRLAGDPRWTSGALSRPLGLMRATSRVDPPARTPEVNLGGS